MNPPTLPTALYRARDVRELDRLAIEEAGIPGIDLMERAGAEAFRVLRARWPAARRVSVVAGPGNNGGDGFVVARLAAHEGLSVSVHLVGDAARIAGDAGDAGTAYRRMLDAELGALTVHRAARAAPDGGSDVATVRRPARCRPDGESGEVTVQRPAWGTADTEPDEVTVERSARGPVNAEPGVVTVRPGAAGSVDGADVIVDALFGIGLARALSGAGAEAVRAMNDSAAPVLALDVPSGIHADTGRVLGGAVRAAVTVCFIALKQGLFTREGREWAGEIVYRDLAVPPWVLERVPASARRMAYEDCAGMLGPRCGDAHKGRFGHVLVVGGDHGFAGAARLAGEAAGRTGAGLVSIATRPGHVGPIVASRPEMMVHGIESPDALDALLDRATVVAVGPGLGRSGWGASLLERVVAADRDLVVDADAINLLAEGAAPWPDAATRAVVYTPHPGEAGRVLGEPASALESDRFSAARALAGAHPGVWLLKGAGTIIAEAGAVPCVCEGGNPGMASGGMGDVLTGVVAALLAQGLDGFDAASAGACLHAAAGDAAAAGGGRGMLASDVIAELRPLVDRL
ncbi:MAG: NAD(P)H-hydrate dehydratase [Thiotrichales bacterium]|nr:NAD(P)H-hydrate dehydratase [Thiotrichales bacterium]